MSCCLDATTSSKPKLCVRAKPDKPENIIAHETVDEQKVRLHMTLSIPNPLATQGVVSVALVEAHAIREKLNNVINQLVEALPAWASLFPPPVSLELG